MNGTIWWFGVFRLSEHLGCETLVRGVRVLKTGIEPIKEIWVHQ
jgi:hypothetical protein